MIVSLLEKIKVELAKYAENGSALKPTDAYQLVSGIKSIRVLSQSNPERYLGYIVSEHANEYSNSAFAKFTNISGKPVIFLIGSNEGAWSPYGSVMVVPDDYIQDTDYKISNGTESSSQYHGWESFTLKTPKKHTIRIWHTKFGKQNTSSFGCYWYMYDRTLNITEDVSNTFVQLKSDYVKNRIAILADYLLFNER